MNQGLELGIKKAEAAGNRAGIEWKNKAYDAFVEYAKNHQTFTVEQVISDSFNVPNPPDKRAWGSIAIKAKKNGIVENAGWTRSLNKNKHGIPVALWKSLVLNN